MVYGCNDPLAINFNPRANAYDNTGALGEQCRAVRCCSPTGPLPTCPSGASPAWKGPSGGVCYRFVGTVEETVPWSCGQMQGMDIPMVEYGDCASCVRLDECASNTQDPAGPCNNPEHRLCVATTGNGGYTFPDCTNTRQSFVCTEATGDANATAFDTTCFDPNPYWPGDYTCGCAYNYTTPEPRYVDSVAATCGVDVIYTEKSSGSNISNYDLSFYLATRSTAREHLCQSLQNPPPDCD